jgi:hypothetical protein
LAFLWMRPASRSRLVDLRLGFSLCGEPADRPIIEPKQMGNDGTCEWKM